MTNRKGRVGRPPRDVPVRHIGVEFPLDVADRILAPVDDGRVKTITDRMIELVKLGLEHEAAMAAPVAEPDELSAPAEPSAAELTAAAGEQTPVVTG
jgi:hypothetical protein